MPQQPSFLHPPLKLSDAERGDEAVPRDTSEQEENKRKLNISCKLACVKDPLNLTPLNVCALQRLLSYVHGATGSRAAARPNCAVVQLLLVQHGCSAARDSDQPWCASWRCNVTCACRPEVSPAGAAPIAPLSNQIQMDCKHGQRKGSLPSVSLNDACTTLHCF